MAHNPDVTQLRERLNDCAVLCSRLSVCLSARELPAEASAPLAAARYCVLAAQQCGMLISLTLEVEEIERRKLREEKIAGDVP